ncbi:hypothetical protein HMPREF9081_1135 [Centipeda periodontii DSM 2778]|jgi:hypothetical protein|uniref:Alkaline shock response membrane anchor protein AmaP n=1 Tax=Centipeda periodontii DSM 2778 TaxID=888060 RepID=F5RLJ9_9FIRM|nr:alkaline shock response membrane anchor protein AmaP [Centipeda periodontii]EGK60122.1 hypothetical protein HMPREF9081_1135 [Centipeda periodontii DSM 2778]
MGILNRLLLLPYALCTMALAIVVAAVALRIIPENIWLNELRYALSRQELLAVCGVFFLVSLKLFFAVFSRTSSSARTHGEFMVVNTPAGAVQVALSAVRGIVEREVLSMQGVRTASAVISVQDAPKDSVETPMQVELKITLADHISLTAISEELTQRVRQNLHDVLGLVDVPVMLRVTEIANAAGGAKRSIS